jgi:hypothetical protein
MAPIDAEVGRGDEATFIVGEEQCGRGEFFGTSRAADVASPIASRRPRSVKHNMREANT